MKLRTMNPKKKQHDQNQDQSISVQLQNLLLDNQSENEIREFTIDYTIKPLDDNEVLKYMFDKQSEGVADIYRLIRKSSLTEIKHIEDAENLF
jgi:hypothetical protein